MNQASATFARLFDFLSRSHWYDDLVEYYHVTPAQAEVLGTRRPGRRPDLPGSATASPVSGKTFEELWDQQARDTPEAIQKFYRDMGAWAAFRQTYRHRHMNASRYMRGLQAGARFCEYGSGVAPICHWIVKNVRQPLALTIVDVESEHFTFGRWRLQKRIAAAGVPFKLTAQVVEGDNLPLSGEYEAIVISEVFEHLHNGLAVTQHLVEHLAPGGRLWENYLVKPPEAADLKEAQEQRAQVFEFLRAACRLEQGEDPDRAPSDTRCWVKR